MDAKPVAAPDSGVFVIRIVSPRDAMWRNASFRPTTRGEELPASVKDHKKRQAGNKNGDGNEEVNIGNDCPGLCRRCHVLHAGAE